MVGSNPVQTTPPPQEDTMSSSSSINREWVIPSQKDEIISPDQRSAEATFDALVAKKEESGRNIEEQTGTNKITLSSESNTPTPTILSATILPEEKTISPTWEKVMETWSLHETSLFTPPTPIHASAEPQIDISKKDEKGNSLFGSLMDPMKDEGTDKPLETKEVNIAPLFWSILENSTKKDENSDMLSPNQDKAFSSIVSFGWVPSPVYGESQEKNALKSSEDSDILKQADAVFIESVARLNAIKLWLLDAKEQAENEAREHHKKMEEEKKAEHEKRARVKEIEDEIDAIEAKKSLLLSELNKKTPQQLKENDIISPLKTTKKKISTVSRSEILHKDA